MNATINELRLCPRAPHLHYETIHKTLSPIEKQIMNHVVAATVALTVMLAGEAAALAGSPAAPAKLHFKELLSRLSAASEDRIRGLSTIQCDYRLMGTSEGSEELPKGKKPPVKLAVSGKLTIHLPEDRAEWNDENPPGTFNTFTLEPDAWPILKDALGEGAAKMLKPFRIPGSKLICSEAGAWLVSKNGKSAVKFAMDSAGQDEVFGPIVPTVCCHYQASIVKAFRADARDAVSTKAGAVSLAGRKCVKYLFELPETGAGAPAGTYTVWLDDATGLPLKEELRGGIAAAGDTAGVTYSDFQPFGKKSFSPAKSEETDNQDDTHCLIHYSPFGTQWFLTKEISVRYGEGSCTMTFANWRQVATPGSAFRLPPGAKVISRDGKADEGSSDENIAEPPAAGSEPRGTIQPGTYLLEWKVPSLPDHFNPRYPFAGPGENLYRVELKPVSASRGRTYGGLKSANAFVGWRGGFFVLLDESKGSGTGYDTAYIAASKADLAMVDVTRAVKVSLKDNPGKFPGAAATDSTLWLANKPGELSTEICIGEPGDQVTERARVDGFKVYQRQTGVRTEPCSAEVTVRGGWYGTITTSKGKLQVRVTDHNGNGVYGDKFQPGWETDEKAWGDTINLIPVKRGEMEDILLLAEAVLIDGQLYLVDVSKTGNRLDIKPYGGETGFLSVGATDGKGKQANCENVSYSGDKGDFWPVDDKPVKVPVGNYRCSASIGAGVYVVSPLVALEKDRTVRFAIGGPLHFDVAPGADAIHAKAGEDRQIETTVYAGQDIMHLASCGKFTATFTDAEGKTVAEQAAINRRLQVQCTQVFTIPKSLQPGAYTVDVRLDARPYQEPVSVRKKLVIE